MPGDSFGEIALRHKVPRSASVRCTKESFFVTLSYQSYHKIINLYHDYLIQREIEGLKKFALFENASIQILEKLFKHMEKIEFRRNKIIYKENDFADNLYFIKSG